MQYIPSATGTNGTWQQISRWEALPSGIVTDCTNPLTNSKGNSLNVAAAFQPTNSPTLTSGTLPTLTYSGNTYRPQQDYGYVIFQADGTLYRDVNNNRPPSPCILRIVQGITTGGATTYQLQNSTKTGPANYYDVVLTDATGQPKIARPEDE